MKEDVNMPEIFSSKDLNAIIGYECKSAQNNNKEQLMTRCRNAGLIVEALPTKRGCPNQYIIIEDNFHKDGEEWRDAYNNIDWEVSNLGRVRRKNTKKLLGTLDPNGYIHVCGKGGDGKNKNFSVQRLIYFSFNPQDIEHEQQIQIDHINGKRDDNRLENLRALTNVENTKARDDNQAVIKTLTTLAISKVGYKKVEETLKQLIENA